MERVGFGDEPNESGPGQSSAGRDCVVPRVDGRPPVPTAKRAGDGGADGPRRSAQGVTFTRRKPRDGRPFDPFRLKVRYSYPAGAVGAVAGGTGVATTVAPLA